MRLNQFAPMAILAAIILSASVVHGADIQLPEPQKTGGKPVLEAIDGRGSSTQNAFPAGAIGREELSTILWAASGHNRDGRLWTVPMGMGRPPYCKIYVVSAEGVHRYDWAKNLLVEVSAQDARAAIPAQPFAKSAPLSLYIVTDGAEMASLNNPMTDEWGALLAGNMSQNIFLAAQAVGVGTRIIYSINRDEARKLLQLGEGDKPLFVMPMGKY